MPLIRNGQNRKDLDLRWTQALFLDSARTWPRTEWFRGYVIAEARDGGRGATQSCCTATQRLRSLFFPRCQLPAWSGDRVSHDCAGDLERRCSRAPADFLRERGCSRVSVPSPPERGSSFDLPECGFGLWSGCWDAERLLGRATITGWMMPSGWGGNSMASEPLAAAGWVNGAHCAGLEWVGQTVLRWGWRWCWPGSGEAFQFWRKSAQKEPANLRTLKLRSLPCGSTADHRSPVSSAYLGDEVL